MKFLMTYIADKGSVVINGICFSNGIGDGIYKVMFDNAKPDDTKMVAEIDLRDCPAVDIWLSDCDSSKAVQFGARDFYDAQAIGFGFDGGGNLIIWKLF